MAWVLVLILVFAFALAEIAMMFPDFLKEALWSPWSWAYLLLNMATSAGALYLTGKTTGQPITPMLGMVVGLGFPTILRSKFTLLKRIGAEGSDLSVDLGGWYDRFARLFRDRMDQAVLDKRDEFVSALMNKYRTPPELQAKAAHLIGLFPNDPEQTQKREYIEKVMQQGVSDEQKCSTLASFILLRGGRKYAEKLLQA